MQGSGNPSVWPMIPQLAPRLRMFLGQEVMTMALDMTAQLAPMLWGMIGLMVISTVSLFVAHSHR